MRDHESWSISLGRWGGLSVRLHAIFLLFAAVVLYASWREAQSLGEGDLIVARMTAAAAALVVVFLSVLAHELSHYRAALGWEGAEHRIVLGPLGGLAPLRTPSEFRAELRAQLAGPLANATICVLCAPLLLLMGEGWNAELLHPLRPPLALADSVPVLASGAFWIRAAFWANWTLLVVNAAPVFPFDGGRALAAGLERIGPTWDRRRSAIAVAHLGRIAAAGLVIAACFAPATGREDLFPPWFALTLLAILVFFSAKAEEERREEPGAAGDLFGYDFSQGFTSLEGGGDGHRSPSGAIARWLERRRQARRRRRQEIEREEERRVDEILLRLHEGGMSSLSHEDRVLLERVSARYRSRQGHRA